MIELRLPSLPYPPPPRIYGIAGQRFASDAPLPELEAFRPDRHQPASGSEGVGNSAAPDARQQVFRGNIELGPRQYFLDCTWHNEGYELDVSGLGRFSIDRYGEQISFDQAPDVDNLTGFSEVFLGPSLILALALHGTWCLHASAVEIDGKILAFLGASGAGKSTLAAALPALSSGRFRTAADDVVPVILNAASAQALPRFPQLKYQPDRQPGAAVPPSLPLGGIYVLDTETDQSGVSIEPIGGINGVLALARHTHTARLFSQQLLRLHTKCCAQLASSLSIQRLVYPKRRQVLPLVEQRLRSEHGAEVMAT